MVLVIMIIILLILSGVTISMITGGNGIINRTIQAVEETQYAEIKEEIMTAWYEVLIDSSIGGLTTDANAELLEEKLQESDPYATAEYDEESGKIIVDYDGYTLEVNPETGEVDNSNITVSLTVSVEIAQNPTNVSVIAGNEATFEVTATGTGEITYQWYYKETSASSGDLINNATENTYTISDVASKNEGYYYVEVTSTYKGETKTVTSSSAKLTVVEVATIAIQGEGTNTIEGETVTLIAEATGDGTFTYQWYKDGSEILGATSATYEITEATSNDAGDYYCEITQTKGDVEVKVTSATATLTVVDQVQVTEDPADVETIEGAEKVSFNTTVSQAEGTITYKWYYVPSGETDGKEISTATTKTYTISSDDVTTSLNGNSYYCIITQVYGDNTVTVETGKATLTVYTAPTIEIEGNSKNYVGNDTTFTASTSGSFDSATYKWYYNTEDEAGEGTLGQTTTDTTSSTDEYQFSTTTANTYYVSCVATFTYEDVTTKATTTTSEIVVEEANYSITSGNTTTYYSTLALAIAGASKGNTIETLQDVTDSSTAIVDKDLTLDTSSYTIELSSSTLIVSSGYTLSLAGTGTMSNGTVSTTGTGIYNTGTANLEGGSINSTGTDSTIYGIYNYQTGELYIDGTTITSGNYGICNYASNSSKPTITMNSGTVSGSTYGIYNYGSSSTYSAVATITGGTVTGSANGIRNNGSASILTIGDCSIDLSITTPLISGGTYGIYNASGTWNFYSGLLKGTASGYYGTATNLRDGCGIATGTEGSFSTSYLQEVSGWSYDDDGNVTNGKVTLKIGDYVDYDEQTGASTTSYTSLEEDNGYGDQVFNLSSYE